MQERMHAGELFQTGDIGCEVGCRRSAQSHVRHLRMWVKQKAGSTVRHRNLVHGQWLRMVAPLLSVLSDLTQRRGMGCTIAWLAVPHD
jgi:hypothetical protein